MSALTFRGVERSPCTVGEAAKALRCTRAEVYSLVANGPLVGLLFGRQAPLWVDSESLGQVLAMRAQCEVQS